MIVRLIFGFMICFPIASLAKKESVSVKLKFEDAPQEQISEVEVVKKSSSSPPQIQKFNGGSVRLELRPDTYILRTRSLDKRGIPGNWGDPFEITVKPKPIQLAAPETQKPLHADLKSGKASASLTWPVADGAERYRLKVQNHKGAQLPVVETKGNSHNLLLEPGLYKWSVAPVSRSGISGDSSETQELKVLGPRIPPGPIKEINSLGFQLDSGVLPSVANISVLYSVQHRKLGEENWKALITDGSASGVKASFQKALTPGEYLLTYKLAAEHWEESEKLTHNFLVKPEPTVLSQATLTLSTD